MSARAYPKPDHVTVQRAPRLPIPRGPLSEAVVHALHRNDGAPLKRVVVDDVDMLRDDDGQLALACCYELHYRSFAGVDDRWEWDPQLLTVRRRLEDAFVDRLEDELGPAHRVPERDVLPAVRGLAHRSDGPSLSKFMDQYGSREHMREFCIHRSAYQLKEADPHTWALPRLVGRAKAAAVTIQHDEYGRGTVGAMHSELFATTMRALGLDPTYGAYLDLLPATTLATGNLVSMFGLHRRWRAACVGHLALFEMTSVQPMTRYASALRRLGFGDDARAFYEVHVTADTWHEQIAQHELVSGLLETEPEVGGTVLFGARALMDVERRMADALLDAWKRSESSLLPLLTAQMIAS